jgi:hypothetical protein
MELERVWTPDANDMVTATSDDAPILHQHERIALGSNQEDRDQLDKIYKIPKIHAILHLFSIFPAVIGSRSSSATSGDKAESTTSSIQRVGYGLSAAPTRTGSD